MHYYIMEEKKGNGLFAKGFKGWWGACGAVGVGIGTGTWAVLFSIPVGACACGAEGHMASIGPLALGAKGCVEGLHPTGGRRLAVRIAIEHPIGALPCTPFPASRDFPSRGNEKIGGTGYCVTYDKESQSRNADFISIAQRAIRNPRPEGPSNLRTIGPERAHQS